MKTSLIISVILSLIVFGQANFVSNPGFETTGSSWSNFGDGFTYDTTQYHSGAKSGKTYNVDATHSSGAAQWVGLSQTTATPFKISGWSKASSVGGSINADYSLYADVAYNDGTYLWGQTANFNTGSHDWEKACTVVYPAKPVSGLSLYSMFRYHAGTAYFDDISVDTATCLTPNATTNPIKVVLPLYINADTTNKLTNPSYERGTTGWSSFGGVSLTTTTAQAMHLNSSIVFTNTLTSDVKGAYQTVTLWQTTANTVTISGWSYASGVSGTANADYSLYADVNLVNGTWLYGYNAAFSTGTHGWEQKTITIVPPAPIASVNVYALFRYHSGTVYFDKVTFRENGPLGAWDRVANTAGNVTTIAIVNPNNGPNGTAPAANYLEGVEWIVGGGAIPIGYVSTNYSSRSISLVKADIDTWANQWSYMKGIFLDETSNSEDPTVLAFYQDLVNYIKVNKSMSIVIMNPGGKTSEKYVPLSDSVVIEEQTYTHWSTYSTDGYVTCPCLTDSPTDAYKYHFTAMIYATSAGNYQNAIQLAKARGFGYIYVTSDDMPNPWDSLPSYWEDEIAYIKSIV